mmetsp:Transcript_6090/g.8504  ORF Transcript_6090/g.8504 Transcript_6090/m.8504 type:complete len:192 (+) Transcript_6090:973-1548(+)
MLTSQIQRRELTSSHLYFWRWKLANTTEDKFPEFVEGIKTYHEMLALVSSLFLTFTFPALNDSNEDDWRDIASYILVVVSNSASILCVMASVMIIATFINLEFRTAAAFLESRTSTIMAIPTSTLFLFMPSAAIAFIIKNLQNFTVKAIIGGGAVFVVGLVGSLYFYNTHKIVHSQLNDSSAGQQQPTTSS